MYNNNHNNHAKGYRLIPLLHLPSLCAVRRLRWWPRLRTWFWTGTNCLHHIYINLCCCQCDSMLIFERIKNINVLYTMYFYSDLDPLKYFCLWILAESLRFVAACNTSLYFCSLASYRRRLIWIPTHDKIVMATIIKNMIVMVICIPRDIVKTYIYIIYTFQFFWEKRIKIA